MRAFIAATTVILIGGDAFARSEALENGRKLVEEQEFVKAIPLLTSAATDKTLPKNEIVEAYLQLATAYSALRRDSEVLESFVKLLRVDRTFRPKRGTPPKIREVFERALRLVEAEAVQVAPTRLSHAPLAKAKGGAKTRIDVAVVDTANRVQSVTLRRRVSLGPTVPYESLLMERAPTGGFKAELALPILGGVLEYYFIARDEKGVAVAALRDEESPFRLLVEALCVDCDKPPTPLYKRWWLWTLIGAGIAGGATAIVLTQSGTTTISSDSGRLRIIVK